MGICSLYTKLSLTFKKYLMNVGTNGYEDTQRCGINNLYMSYWGKRRYSFQKGQYMK